MNDLDTFDAGPRFPEQEAWNRYSLAQNQALLQRQAGSDEQAMAASIRDRLFGPQQNQGWGQMTAPDGTSEYHYGGRDVTNQVVNSDTPWDAFAPGAPDYFTQWRQQQAMLEPAPRTMGDPERMAAFQADPMQRGLTGPQYNQRFMGVFGEDPARFEAGIRANETATRQNESLQLANTREKRLQAAQDERDNDPNYRTEANRRANLEQLYKEADQFAKGAGANHIGEITSTYNPQTRTFKTIRNGMESDVPIDPLYYQQALELHGRMLNPGMTSKLRDEHTALKAEKASEQFGPSAARAMIPPEQEMQTGTPGESWGVNARNFLTDPARLDNALGVAQTEGALAQYPIIAANNGMQNALDAVGGFTGLWKGQPQGHIDYPAMPGPSPVAAPTEEEIRAARNAVARRRAATTR